MSRLTIIVLLLIITNKLLNSHKHKPKFVKITMIDQLMVSSHQTTVIHATLKVQLYVIVVHITSLMRRKTAVLAVLSRA